MAYGVRISNITQSGVHAIVFDSTNPAHAMPQPIMSIDTVAGVDGTAPLAALVTPTEITEQVVGVFPLSTSGNPPKVTIENETLRWSYTGVTSPTAVNIVVFT